jgi:EthD domain
MIKSVSLLTRRPELTHEQFVRHWVEIHAPLAHAVPGMRRYVQNHIQGTRTRPDIPETARRWRAPTRRPRRSACTTTARFLSAGSKASLSKRSLLSEAIEFASVTA